MLRLSLWSARRTRWFLIDEGNCLPRFELHEPYLIAEPYEHESRRAFTFQIIIPPCLTKSEHFDVPDAACFDHNNLIFKKADRYSCLRSERLRLALQSMVRFYAVGGWDGPASFFNQEGLVGHAKGIIEADELTGALPYLEVSEDEFEREADQQIKGIGQIRSLAEFNQRMPEEWD